MRTTFFLGVLLASSMAAQDATRESVTKVPVAAASGTVVSLQTHVVLPGAAGRFPTMLMRTPYGGKQRLGIARRFARRRAK